MNKNKFPNFLFLLIIALVTTNIIFISNLSMYYNKKKQIEIEQKSCKIRNAGILG